MADKKISALTGATTPLTGTEVLPIVQGGSTVKVAVSDLTAGRAVSASSVTVSGIATFGTGRQWFTSNDVSYAFLSTVTGGSGNGIYADANNSGLMVNGGGIAIATSTGLGINGNITPNTAAKGVNFTANTPAAGMTSQLLNWYEEGTFTPTITGYSTPGVGTYTTQLGTYTRVGNVVNFAITITQTAHTGAGVMIVNGLPFTIGGPSGSIYAASARSSNLTLTALNVLQVALGAGFTNFALEQVPVGGGTAANVSMDVAFDLSITGSYFV